MNYNPTGQKERRFVGGVPANTVDMVTSGSIGNRAISYFRFALFRMLQLGLLFFDFLHLGQSMHRKLRLARAEAVNRNNPLRASRCCL